MDGGSVLLMLFIYSDIGRRCGYEEKVVGVFDVGSNGNDAAVSGASAGGADAG